MRPAAGPLATNSSDGPAMSLPVISEVEIAGFYLGGDLSKFGDKTIDDASDCAIDQAG